MTDRLIDAVEDYLRSVRDAESVTDLEVARDILELEVAELAAGGEQ